MHFLLQISALHKLHKVVALICDCACTNQIRRYHFGKLSTYDFIWFSNQMHMCIQTYDVNVILSPSLISLACLPPYFSWIQCWMIFKSFKTKTKEKKPITGEKAENFMNNRVHTHKHWEREKKKWAISVIWKPLEDNYAWLNHRLILMEPACYKKSNSQSKCFNHYWSLFKMTAPRSSYRTTEATAPMFAVVWHSSEKNTHTQNHEMGREHNMTRWSFTTNKSRRKKTVWHIST